MRTGTHSIDGAEDTRVEERTATVFNPATGEQRAEVLLAAADDVDRAQASAQAALHDCSRSALSRRTDILFAFREIVSRRKAEIAAHITDEHAKVLSDATGEVHMHGPDGVRFYARVVTQRWPDPQQDASFDMPRAR